MELGSKAAVADRIKNLDPQVVARYLEYWESIAPQTLHERWQRWVFATMAINTGWEQNVRAYKLVMSMPWSSLSELEELLVAGGIGLHSAKAQAAWCITTLARDECGPRVLGSPAEVGRSHLPWTGWRDRLEEITDNDNNKRMTWMGLKTISFAHEMCWPRECEVVAIDTHVARWYGIGKGKLTATRYHEIEDHWLNACAKYGVPSAMARHVIWDQEHDKTDTRYWSHVFEERTRVDHDTDGLGHPSQAAHTS